MSRRTARLQGLRARLAEDDVIRTCSSCLLLQQLDMPTAGWRVTEHRHASIAHHAGLMLRCTRPERERQVVQPARVQQLHTCTDTSDTDMCCQSAEHFEASPGKALSSVICSGSRRT